VESYSANRLRSNGRQIRSASDVRYSLLDVPVGTGCVAVLATGAVVVVGVARALGTGAAVAVGAAVGLEATGSPMNTKLLRHGPSFSLLTSLRSDPE
jgi:hypothetical protein